MKKRWAPAFTIVELLIVIVVVAVLATISVIGYNGVRKSAINHAAQSDLDRVATEMERQYQKTGQYPSKTPAALPTDMVASNNITLTIVRSGNAPFYTGLTAVQNGTLLAQICQQLIDEGVGKGVDQGGATRDYISSCGNWNHDSMQFTAWDTKKWDVPVTSEQLLGYADSYTVTGAFHKAAQEGAVKNFYRELVSRHQQQGGSFPITSFWDYWANSSNGGVQQQPLATNPQTRPYYCVQAQANSYSDIIWKVTQDTKIKAGAC